MLSILVIHYKRTELAIDAVSSIKRLGLDNVEYILSDDGTPNLSLQKLSHHFDTIIVSTRNKGLGHNMNQAFMAARGKYLLIMQEDTEFIGNKHDVENSIAALDTCPQIALIRYYGSWIVDLNAEFIERKKLPNLDQDLYIINHTHSAFGGIAYSDMPHIRRNPCATEFHWMYTEGSRMELSEQEYVNRFSRGNTFAAFLRPNNDLIVHKGDLTSHRTSQWDYSIALWITRAARKYNLNLKNPALKPLRRLVVALLPHARITYKG